MLKNPSKNILRELGKKYLQDKEDKFFLRWLLRKNEIHIAQVFLLGFIDRALGKKKISITDAYEEYEKLGISPEEAIALYDTVEEHLRSRRTKH